MVCDIFAFTSAWARKRRAGQGRVENVLAGQLRRLTEWWDKFATIEVGEIGGIRGRDVRVGRGRWPPP